MRKFMIMILLPSGHKQTHTIHNHDIMMACSQAYIEGRKLGNPPGSRIIFAEEQP